MWPVIAFAIVLVTGVILVRWAIRIVNDRKAGELSDDWKPGEK